MIAFILNSDFFSSLRCISLNFHANNMKTTPLERMRKMRMLRSNDPDYNQAKEKKKAN